MEATAIAIIILLLFLYLFISPKTENMTVVGKATQKDGVIDTTSKFNGTFTNFNGRMAIDDQYFYDKLFAKWGVQVTVLNTSCLVPLTVSHIRAPPRNTTRNSHYTGHLHS